MIIKFKKDTSKEIITNFIKGYEGAFLLDNIAVIPSNVKTIDDSLKTYVDEAIVLDNDIQLASKKFQEHSREIKINDDIIIGGNTKNTLMITGPCSIESEEQIESVAKFLKENNIKILRAGCYKPRTSPYSFQGMGLEGLKLLKKTADKYNLKIITEVRDSSHCDDVIEYSDIIQIGSKAMYDHGILKKCAKTQKPVLIKRHFGASVQEWVQAAEFVLSGGNPNVILCERGIRTFETKTRFTLDLCSVAYIKEYTNLPVIIDPSHAMGYAYGVADLTRAAVAFGTDGIIIETHPDPKNAKSDAAQQLNFEQFKNLNDSLQKVANSVGRKMR